MRRVLVAAVLISLVGLYPAQAKRADQSLTLTGDRTAYVDVEFDRPITLDVGATRIEYGGSHAGWLMHPAGSAPSRDLTGSYAIRDAQPDSGSKPSDTLNYGKVKLKSGTYRFYLLADGPTTVRIPIVSGAESFELRPTTPTTSISKTVDFTVGDAGMANEEHRTPVHVGPSSFGASIITVASESGLALDSIDACFAPAGGDCEPPALQGAIVGSDEGSWMSYSARYSPGELEAGEYEAIQSAMTAGSIKTVTGATLLVDLVES